MSFLRALAQQMRRTFRCTFAFRPKLIAHAMRSQSSIALNRRAHPPAIADRTAVRIPSGAGASARSTRRSRPTVTTSRGGAASSHSPTMHFSAAGTARVIFAPRNRSAQAPFATSCGSVRQRRRLSKLSCAVASGLQLKRSRARSPRAVSPRRHREGSACRMRVSAWRIRRRNSPRATPSNPSRHRSGRQARGSPRRRGTSHCSSAAPAFRERPKTSVAAASPPGPRAPSLRHQ